MATKPHDPAVRKLLDAAAGADHEQLELRDAILDAFSVTVAGVDVTHAWPRLEPELEREKKEPPEPKPERQGAGNRARRGGRRSR